MLKLQGHYTPVAKRNTGRKTRNTGSSGPEKITNKTKKFLCNSNELHIYKRTLKQSFIQASKNLMPQHNSEH